MHRLDKIMMVLMLILILTGCQNSPSMLEKDEIESESNHMSETQLNDMKIVHRLVSDMLALKMDEIEAMMQEIARDQVIVKVLFKEEEAYDSIFDMLQEQEKVIGSKVNEIMFHHTMIHRIYFLDDEGVIYDSGMDNNDHQKEVRSITSEGFDVYSYLDEEQNHRIIFQAKLRNILDNKAAYVFFEVDKTYLLQDIEHTENELPQGFYFEVYDIDATELLHEKDMEHAEKIDSEINKFGWEVCIFQSDDL